MNEVVKIKDEFKHVSEKEKEKKKEGVHSCNEAIFMNEDGINDPFTFSYDRDHYEQCEDAPRSGEKIGALEIPTEKTIKAKIPGKTPTPRIPTNTTANTRSGIVRITFKNILVT